MAQDIREMTRNAESSDQERLSNDHQKRFKARLEKAFPVEKKPLHFLWLKIAAVLIVVFGVGFLLLNRGSAFDATEVVESQEDEQESRNAPTEVYRLSDVSPDYRKIENYYLANLNVELAQLEVSEDNKALVDSFMAQLAELDQEYNRLNQEILLNGFSQSSVEALISNLQMRLELLEKLKNKLTDINQSKIKNYENREA